MKRVAAALLAAGLLAAGCSPSRSNRSQLTVLAAASLVEAFTDYPAGPRSLADPAVTFSFAGSQQLVAQVEAGVPADVIATADEVSMERLVRAGLVEEPSIFARNRLVIAVRRGNPEGVGTLADLARPGLRVALADTVVPAGRHAAQALDLAGVRVKPVSLELDVKAVAARVVSGEAHAGIVYATDVRSAPGVEGVDIPDAVQNPVRYPVAVIRATRRPHVARSFVSRLLDLPIRSHLAARGFLLP